MTEPVSTVVPDSLAGERVDRAVALLTGLSRQQATDLVAAGGVEVAGEVVTVRSRRVRAGETLAIAATVAPDTSAQPDVSVPAPVVHVDDAVIVVDKPADLVVHPGAGTPGGTLVNGLVAAFPELARVGPDPQRPGIVHRLDRGTTGLLVVARTPAAYESLVAQLAGRTVERRYVALALGALETDRGMVDAAIGRHPRDPTKMAVTADGRPARTRYTVTERFPDPPSTLLECALETGRTHQIRVHLAAIGHPVAGDARYGGGRGRLALDRPFLHAHRLAFDHPQTGDRVAFESPLPQDLADVLAHLRRTDS